MSGLMPIFVAVGNNVAAVSQNGAIWSLTSIPAGSWTNVIFGGDRFVAVSADGKTAYTTTGYDWVLGGPLTGGTGPADIAYDGTTFLVTNWNNGNYVFLSPDAVTWTRSTISVNFPAYVASPIGGPFVLFQNGSSATGYTSSNGTTWVGHSLTTTQTWAGVSHNGSRYIAISNGTTSVNVYSSDGATWTKSTGTSIISTSTGRVLACNGSTCVAANNVSALVYRTTDGGATWASVVVPGGGMKGSCYGNGLFVTVGTSACITSPDGSASSWVSRTMPTGGWTSTAFAFLPYGDQVFDGKVLDGSNLVAGPTDLLLGPGSPNGRISRTSRVRKTNRGTN